MPTRLLSRNGRLDPTFKHSHGLRVHRFHSTPARAQDDHYATLELSPTASQADIKKQFYRLSKAHHPDHNPTNADASSKKFVAISNAYATLGNPSKREKYDAELSHSRGGVPSGSYSSSSGYQPGGRKASGLSKRRHQFRGPPPSFYRSGGWGASSAKREANMGRDARDFNAKQQQEQQEKEQGRTSGAGGATGGVGGAYSGAYGASAGYAPGSWPFHTDPNDVAHFDRDGHYKTQSKVQDQLRQGRLRRRAVQLGRKKDTEQQQRDESSDLGRFMWIFGVLVVGIAAVPFWSASK